MNTSKIKRKAVLDDKSLNYTLIILAAISLLILFTAIYLIAFGISGRGGNTGEGDNQVDVSVNNDYPFKLQITPVIPDYSETVTTLVAKTDTSDGLYSEFAALIDMTTGEIIASKKAQKMIYPASMTKVMSLIVVYENLPNKDSLKDKITITRDMIDQKIREQLSGDLYMEDELTVEDMIYALMLKSDGIAALGLAEYIAGSEAAFVDLMNQKATELGLKQTNFTNCTGIHSEKHYTTCQEMARIMMYAMQNPFCAEVMSAASYRTVTNAYPDGITFYHSLLVTKFENELPYLNLTSVDVTAGKTGWTGDESGRCLVSYAVGENGHKYVLVTAKAPNKNEEVLDLEYIYNNFAK